ncbi:MAG: hypothetical protein VW405_19040 [Rhodospirillaceae bacterium]
MRVKTFTADSTAAAMDMVRDALGDDAIITSTHTERDGTASITAAVEPAQPANEDFEEHEPLVFPGETESTVRQAMAYHGVPPWLSGQLARTIAEAGAPTLVDSFAQALERHFEFMPLDAEWPDGPLSLIGPSGAGKTVAAAKICARERLAKRPVVVISADTRRAGGIQQLAAFTRILEIDLTTAAGPDKLAEAVAELRADGRRIVIDTPGGNPLDGEEMAALSDLVAAAGGVTALVMPAGGDPMEAVDVAQTYAEMGAELLIASRLDMARRYGGLMAAAEGAGLTFTQASISAQIADGLIPVTPTALARLIVPHTEPTDESTETTEAPDEQ